MLICFIRILFDILDQMGLIKMLFIHQSKYPLLGETKYNITSLREYLSCYRHKWSCLGLVFIKKKTFKNLLYHSYLSHLKCVSLLLLQNSSHVFE